VATSAVAAPIGGAAQQIEPAPSVLDRPEVRLEETKSKRTRIVPLTDRAVAIFVATRHLSHGPFVFTNPAKRVGHIEISVAPSNPPAGGPALPTSAFTTFDTPSPHGQFRTAWISIA
jgi:hypothetical protein